MSHLQLTFSAIIKPRIPCPGNGSTHSGQVFTLQLNFNQDNAQPPKQGQRPILQVMLDSVKLTINIGHLLWLYFTFLPICKVDVFTSFSVVPQL